MKIFKCSHIKNQERYRPTFNAGPFKHLPVAYMRQQEITEKEMKRFVIEDLKEKEDIEEAGFKANFEDDSESEEAKEESKEELKEASESKFGKRRKRDEMENDEREIHEETKGMSLEVMRWGMVRADTNQPVINCRFEDCLKTNMFRGLLKDFRCIITINGYYEWKVNDKDKQPFYLYPKEGEYLQLAGLFRPQRQPDGTIVNSFVICTLEAMDNISFIHHRMPVILTPELQKIWLDPTIEPKTVFSKVCRSSPKDMLSYYKVADVVNKIKNDNEDCIMKLEDYKKKLHSRGLGRFFGFASKKPQTSVEPPVPNPITQSIKPTQAVAPLEASLGSLSITPVAEASLASAQNPAGADPSQAPSSSDPKLDKNESPDPEDRKEGDKS
ncbi:unnamed protein product [Moneuplotes crassus]|uniref:Embryonic stem cell-specific 5-hydroxymethylcytosine-binding protein n=1 Tax=Euplotes crassus TaxID=5936 RepID=A0AAD1UJ45_EUPCR|nr:unnamed protein product [Moneuplotes crassus]